MIKKQNSFNKNKKKPGAPRVFVDPNSDAQKQRRIDEGVKRGRVVEALPNAMFKVEYEDGTKGLAMLGGKMKVFKIRILVGDNVEAIIDPYSKKGRITKRGQFSFTKKAISGIIFHIVEAIGLGVLSTILEPWTFFV